MNLEKIHLLKNSLNFDFIMMLIIATLDTIQSQLMKVRKIIKALRSLLNKLARKVISQIFSFFFYLRA